MIGTSQVPGRPSPACHVLGPRRARCTALSLRLRSCASVMPSTVRKVSATRDSAFGALSHGRHAHCLRFAADLAIGSRKTRFRLGGSLGRVGLDPQDCFVKFQDVATSSFLLTQASATWRTLTLWIGEVSHRTNNTSFVRVNLKHRRRECKQPLLPSLKGPLRSCSSPPHKRLKRRVSAVVRQRPGPVSSCAAWAE